jgi:heme exporter protein A
MPEARSRVLLSCTGVSCARQGRALFHDLGFSLLEGGVLLLRGRNGSGKTTLLKYLAGLFEGAGCVTRPDNTLFLGHKDAVKLEMSVEENIRFWAELCGEKLLLDAAIHYFGLAPWLDIPCHQLSAGWRKRVALARLLTNPAFLWLLDEPFTHLDDEAVRLLGGLIAGRARKGGAVVLSAHHLPPGALGGQTHAQEMFVEDFSMEIADAPTPL